MAVDGRKAGNTMSGHQLMDSLEVLSQQLLAVSTSNAAASIFLDWLQDRVDPVAAVLFSTVESGSGLGLLGAKGLPLAPAVLQISTTDVSEWFSRQCQAIPGTPPFTCVHIDLSSSQNRVGCLCLAFSTDGDPTVDGAMAWESPLIRLGILLLTHTLLAMQQATGQPVASASKAERFSILYRVGQALTTTLDWQKLCAIAYREINRLVDCPNFGVSSYDPERQLISPTYIIGDGQELDGSELHPIPLQPNAGPQSQAIASRKPVIVADLEAMRPHLPTFQRLRSPDPRSARSLLVAPMITGDKVSGTLQVQSYAPNQYSPEDAELLVSIANQLAAALENARLFAQTEQRLRVLDAISRVTSALRVAESLDEMLPILLDETLAVMGTDAGSILLYHPETNRLREEVARGWLKNLPNGALKPEDGIGGRVFRTGEIYLSTEFRSDAQTWSVTRDWASPGWGGVCMPVRSAHEIVGVFYVGISQPRQLTQEEIDLLMTLCGMAGNAIHRTRLHEQLEAQALRMQKIMAAVPDGLVLLDSECVPVLVNPAANAYFQLLSNWKPGEKLLYLGDCQILALCRSGQRLGKAVEVSGNSNRLFELVAHGIGDPGGHTHFVLVVRDVTQARLLQNQMQQQQRLAAVGHLAAGIAHDFNNILAVITLYTQMVQLQGSLLERDRSRLDIVYEQAQHATNLIQQILDFSRQSVLSLKPLDLAPFLKEFVKLLRRTLPENIDILLSQDAEEIRTPFLVVADPTRLQQAMMNLAINARDAMPDGGTLDLTVAVHHGVPVNVIDPQDDGNEETTQWVRLQVRDTGVGIAPEHMPRIFEPFFTLKEVGQGTGLGLAQLYGIVRQHKGHVGVTSEIGVGTCFTLYLPQTLSAQFQPVEIDNVPEVEGDGQLILVVEDNPATGAVLQDTLESFGYRVLRAGNGLQALEFYTQHEAEIRLVLSDLVMPGMDGRGLYRALYARRPDIRFVVITGYPLEDEGRGLLEEGIVAWLQKPFKIAKLIDLVQKLVDE